MWRASGTPIIEYDDSGKSLSRPHQIQGRRQPKAALAGKRNGFQFRTSFVAGTGKTDADLMAAEHGILALGRRGS
jgi:hypothetical protein